MPLTFFDAFTQFGPKSNMHGSHPWSLDHLVAEMQHCSISGALVGSTMCLQYDAMLENRRLTERLACYDFLFPIWNVMPHWTGEFPEPRKLAKLMRESGIRAVRLHPRTNGWTLLSESSRPLLKELQRSRTLSIIDMRMESNEMEIEQLAGRYPRLPILLIGMGWGRQRAIIPVLLKHKNVHVAFDHFQINRGIEWLAQHGCAGQLVYASNATDMSMGAHRCYVDYSDLPRTTRQKIAGGNLTRLLKGLKPPREIVNQDEDALMAEAREAMPLSCHVLDFHAHILDEGLDGAGGAYTMFGGGPKGMLNLADRMGVTGIGLMSWNGTVGSDAEMGNECVRAALDTFGDRAWGLATFDPVRQTAEETAAKIEKTFADRRFLGLKPYPVYGKHYDHAVYEGWWKFGNKHRLYALIHVNRGDFSEFDALCPKYPDMTFVAAHCGQSYDTADHAIRLARKYPNFMIEITLTPTCMGIVDYLAHGAGAERVLYGSDQPMRDPRPQFGWVIYSRLPVEDKKKILGLNGKTLLDCIRRNRI